MSIIQRHFFCALSPSLFLSLFLSLSFSACVRVCLTEIKRQNYIVGIRCETFCAIRCPSLANILFCACPHRARFLLPVATPHHAPPSRMPFLPLVTAAPVAAVAGHLEIPARPSSTPCLARPLSARLLPHSAIPFFGCPQNVGGGKGKNKTEKEKRGDQQNKPKLQHAAAACGTEAAATSEVAPSGRVWLSGLNGEAGRGALARMHCGALIVAISR